MISKILSFQTNGTVSLVQYITEHVNTVEYISGNEAIEKNYIEVKEVDESGSVNNLIVINNSSYMVFFSDGDILSGAKQNRVLNTSVLIAAKSKTIIPVSCVERGRWRHTSPKFKGSDYLAPSILRAKKSDQVKENLKINSGFLCSQYAVWDDIKDYQKKYDLDCPTDNLSDLYDQKRIDIDKFISDFKVDKEANGMVVFIKNKILSIDAFNRINIFQEYFYKILRGVSSEAIYVKKDNSIISEAEIKYKSMDFFDKLEKTKYNTYPGVSLGSEVRYDSDKIAGFNLIYDDHFIHLTAAEIN